MNRFASFSRASKRTRARRRGAALLEFALVATLFLTMVMGMLQFGIYLSATNTLWNLSREGARYASVQREDDPDANQKIINHISKPSPTGMLPPNINANNMTISISPTEPKDRTKGAEVKIVISYDMSEKFFVPMGGMLPKQYVTTTTMMVE